MSTTLEVKIKIERLPLSRSSVRALRNVAQYDHVVLTSKNARRFFVQALQEFNVKSAVGTRIIQVGPRVEILKYPLRGMRILFPRSARAPYDIVKRMRARGATVRPIVLYTAYGVPLSRAQKESVLAGKTKQLYFKSPSGIDGFMQQFRGAEHRQVLAISALCIGTTTAKAARKAGFKHVNVKNV